MNERKPFHSFFFCVLLNSDIELIRSQKFNIHPQSRRSHSPPFSLQIKSTHIFTTNFLFFSFLLTPCPPPPYEVWFQLWFRRRIGGYRRCSYDFSYAYFALSLPPIHPYSLRLPCLFCLSPHCPQVVHPVLPLSHYNTFSAWIGGIFRWKIGRGAGKQSFPRSSKRIHSSVFASWIWFPRFFEFLYPFSSFIFHWPCRRHNIQPSIAQDVGFVYLVYGKLAYLGSGFVHASRLEGMG